MRKLALLSMISLLCLGAYSQQVDSRFLSPLPDQARDDAIGFAIEGTGYILGGRKSDFAISDQVWAYDPDVDLWTPRAPFPGTARQYAEAIVLDGQAYVLCGLSDPSLYLNEVWRYEPEEDEWTQLADFPGGARFAPTAFVYKGEAYLGLGYGEDDLFTDLWKYDPESDSWEKILDFDQGRYSALAMQVGDQVLIGLGMDDTNSPRKELWSFDGQRMTASADFKEGIGNGDAIELRGRSILVGGLTASEDAISTLSILEQNLDMQTEGSVSWNRESELIGGPKRNGSVFQIGNKGYYFGGKDELGQKSNSLIELRLKEPAIEVSVYPNPVEREFRLISEQSFDKIRLMDLSGLVVMEKAWSESQFSTRLFVQELEKGIYLLQLDEDRLMKVVKN